MPKFLPMAYVHLSAFLADADCRAGMYQVPPVSAAALASAAADDAAAAAAAAKMAIDLADKAAVAAAAADSDASLTDSEDLQDEHEPAVAFEYVATGAGAEQRHSSGGGGGGPGVLRRRPVPGSAEAAAEAAAAGGAAGQDKKKHRKPHLDKWRRWAELLVGSAAWVVLLLMAVWKVCICMCLQLLMCTYLRIWVCGVTLSWHA
jgi:hypothetical protein